MAHRLPCASGTYGSLEAGTRSRYVPYGGTSAEGETQLGIAAGCRIQYRGPGSELPCASGTYSSQEAGTGYACGLRKARELCVSRGRYPGRGGGQRASQHVSARELLLLLLRSPGARPRLGRVGRQLQRRHRRQAQEKRDVHDSFAAALRHHHARLWAA